MPDLSDFQNLAIAGAIGFLIGFEREWRDRTEARERFAGARTFTLAGLAGGAAGLMDANGIVVAAGLIGVFAIVSAAYWAQARTDPGTGATTEISYVVTYLLGALATSVDPALAGAGGVGAAILLAMKPRILAAARTIESKEIGAALRFLAISVIVLPLLPDQGYGPYEALNPRKLWYYVVLISGLSFAGYWLIKLYGARGVLLTGVVGGLASSTATTLSLARLVKQGAAPPLAGAAGAVAANVVMLVRVAAILFVTARSVLVEIGPPLAAAALAGAVLAFGLSRRDRGGAANAITVGNPMELKPALVFAVLLAAITLASRFAVEQFGSQGFYALSAFAGLADVDAVVLSAADQSREALSIGAAGAGVLIACAVNMALKGGMLTTIGGWKAGAPTLAVFAAMAAAGAAALMFP